MEPTRVKCIKCGKETMGGEYCAKCYIEEHEIDFEKISKKNREKKFKLAGLQIVQYGYRLDNFLTKNKVLERSKKVAEKYLKKSNDFIKEGRGLYISGVYGCGKTHLACAVIQELINKRFTIYFSTVSQLLADLKSDFFDKPYRDKSLYDLVRTCDLLILDDIGAEKITDWVRETLFIILNYRYSNLKSTIFTSNKTVEQLAKVEGYGRLASRIIERNFIIDIKSLDYRERK